MECDICRRGHDPARLPFLCAVDARNRLYEGRYENIQLLLQNETLCKQIASHESQTDALLQSVRSGRSSAEDETTRILEAADKLRDEIQAARDEIQTRKTVIARRRADLATMSEGLLDRRAKQQKSVEKLTQRLNYRWSQSAEEMATTRAFLCSEAADLYGLRRLMTDSTHGMPTYELGKVQVINLLDMNSIDPCLLTTSLGHVAHLVMLTSYYFAIRLPAEITLPHKDYPFPTINTIPSSYKGKTVSFPGNPLVATPNPSNPESSSKSPSRARPLYIHKPLPQLLRDDPTAYSFFLEGVALLAYNVAWLCSSQAILMSDQNVFEDICQIGRNMYKLLVESQSIPGNIPAKIGAQEKPDKPNHEPGTAGPSWIGRFSHGTLYYHLGSAEGHDFVRSFKLPSPIKVADKLKKKLVGDAPAPDWELLEDDAWKVEDDFDSPQISQQKPVAAGNSKESNTKSSSTGANGWMKVK